MELISTIREAIKGCLAVGLNDLKLSKTDRSFAFAV